MTVLTYFLLSTSPSICGKEGGRRGGRGGEGGSGGREGGGRGEEKKK